MRVALYLVIACLLTVGAIWTLQEHGILPGTFLSSQLRMDYRGEIVLLAGFALFGLGMMLPKE